MSNKEQGQVAEKEEEFKALTESNFKIPAVYKELVYDNYNKFCLSSGRISGKTSMLVVLWWLCYNKYPDNDIVILQSTQTDIKSSIIDEIRKFLINSGYSVSEDPKDEFCIPKSDTEISWKLHEGKTYFFPITDSTGGQRSRGKTTPHPQSLVLYEEAQKNKDRNILDQSVATFIRQIAPFGKIVVVGNNETIGHWFVDYVEEKKNDPEWCYIYANCYDIWELLNKQTQDYLIGQKKANPIEFRRIFLGDINANTSDVVFPQFKRADNYKRKDELDPAYITKLILGIDHATANDKFAVVPVAVLDNGRTQTLEVLVDDPKETNITLAPTEQCDLLDDFLVFLDKEYGIVDNRLEIIMSVDGAAAPFIAQLRHKQRTSKNKAIWRLVTIKGFTLKKKDYNLSIIKNAFAYGVLTVLNEGRYCWDGSANKHRLAREIEQQRYKNGKLDPRIENDICDALEYGLVPYYTNCYNLSFPIRVQYIKDSHVEEVKGVVLGKEIV